MTRGADVFTVTIRKRTGWFWGLAGLWLLLEVLFVQTAVASVGKASTARPQSVGLSSACLRPSPALRGCAGEGLASAAIRAGNNKRLQYRSQLASQVWIERVSPELVT